MASKSPAVAELERFMDRFNTVANLSASLLAALYDFEILQRGPFE